MDIDPEQVKKEFDEMEAEIVDIIKEYEEELPYMNEVTKKEREAIFDTINEKLQEMLKISKE